jgi:hypothetical protein
VLTNLNPPLSMNCLLTKYFSLRSLAQLWSCSEDTIQRLIDTGDLSVAVNIAPTTSTRKAMMRVPRRAVVDFLNSRKDSA